MRYQITVSGTMRTSFTEETIRRDFPHFVRSLAAVHGDLVPDSIALVSVEALPEPTPEPVTGGQEETVDLTSMITALHATVTAVHDRLDRAGL